MCFFEYNANTPPKAIVGLGDFEENLEEPPGVVENTRRVGDIWQLEDDLWISGSFTVTNADFDPTTNDYATIFTSTGSETITPDGESFHDVHINDGLIAYWKLEGLAGFHIRVMDSDGGNVKRLSDGPGDQSPHWRP